MPKLRHLGGTLAPLRHLKRHRKLPNCHAHVPVLCPRRLPNRS
ncbi:MAG TPA: hypothetical protein VF897_14705 [Roseiflexaceae bacterium]